MDADAVELRVLGCLLEKQRTTPDTYPLSLNALRLACNQSTNREPVVDYDEATIRGALERLYEAPDWEARFGLVDVVLMTRLARATPPPAAVSWAWRRLVAEAGRLAVHELTAELACSRRYLAAQFREHVGLAPKPIARILRFQRAVGLLEQDGEPHLEEIALACGYYDQPHFNRDFRAFAGSTPTEFLARLFPTAPGLAPD